MMVQTTRCKADQAKDTHLHPQMYVIPTSGKMVRRMCVGGEGGSGDAAKDSNKEELRRG